MKPLAIDLFCSAGGVTKGLQRAGFYVVGYDIKPQPRYCGDKFIQGDALSADLRGAAFVWASPPCQAFTLAGMNQRRDGAEYPDLVDATRQKLIANGALWAIENVPGAPVRADAILCGSQFDLPIVRHRLIEASFTLPLTAPCNHVEDVITVCGQGTPSWMRRKRIARGLHPNASVDMKRAAMGIDWMNREELSQAIPPAYSEFIGRAALNHLASLQVAA